MIGYIEGIFLCLSSDRLKDQGWLRRLMFAPVCAALSAFIVSLCFTLSLTPAYSQTPPASSISQEDSVLKGLNALKQHRLDEALDAFTAAEQRYPSDANVRNFRGIVLAQLGRNEEAAAEYQEAIRLEPKNKDAYRNLGFLRWTERRYGEAREALTRAVSLFPDDSFAHYYLGRVQLDTQQFTEALRELKLPGVSWPADPDFLIQVATGYEAIGKRADACEPLNELLKLPLDDTQSARVASLLLNVQQNEKAIELLTKSSTRQLAGSGSWVQFDLALAYLLSGRAEQAVEQGNSHLELLRKSKAKPNEMAPAWSLVGLAYARLGHGTLAVEALRQAATLDPHREEGWLNLTRELMELGRYAEAISAAEKGIAANPNSYVLQLRLGAASLAAGQYHDAERVFRSLADAGDPLPTSYIGLAQVLLREGRAEDAVSELSAARERIGSNFLINYFLGLSLDRAAKRTEAITAFQEALRLNPDSSEANLGLGKSTLAVGRIGEAIAALSEAVRLAPGNAQAQRLLSQAYRRIGDTKNAAKYAETSAETSSVPETDLLGDFLLPAWRMPEQSKRE